MKTINNYFDEAKQKLGSDYKISQAFNVKPSVITMMKKRGQVSDETAIKIADLLEIDRAEVLLAASIARSSGEVKKAWEKISKLSGIAAGIALYFNSLGFVHAKSLFSMYIMLNFSKGEMEKLHFTPGFRGKVWVSLTLPTLEHSQKVNLGVLLRQVKTPAAGNFPFISLHSCVSPI